MSSPFDWTDHGGVDSWDTGVEVEPGYSSNGELPMGWTANPGQGNDDDSCLSTALCLLLAHLLIVATVGTAAIQLL